MTTARRILLAICISLACASLCWGQYATNFQTGTVRAVPYLSTANLWKALPAKTLTGMVNGADGTIYVLDAAGCVFFYDFQVRTYTQQSAWGCGYLTIGMSTELDAGGGVIYPVFLTMLKTDATCASGYMRQYTWNGTGNPVMGPNCFKFFTGGINSYMYSVPGHVFFRTPTVTTDIGPDWRGGFVYDERNACAFKYDTVFNQNVSRVYLLDNRTEQFVLFFHQPPFPGGTFTGATGCLINEDTFMVTDGTKNYYYDWDSDVWTVLNGTGTNAATVLAGPTESTILGIVGGQPKHLNTYPGLLSGTTSGSLNQCPVGTTCPNGVTHTGTIQVTLPRLLPGTGTLSTQTVSPTTNMSVSSTAVGLDCDPLFGDPTDVACMGASYGGVHCNFSGANFSGGAGGTQPPAIPSGNRSLDIRAWDHTSSLFDTRPLGNNMRVGKANWGSTVDACNVGTRASCPGLNITSPPKRVLCTTNDPINDPCTDADLQIEVDKYGFDHSLLKKPAMSWWYLDEYQLVNGQKVCLGLPALGYRFTGLAFHSCK